MTGFTYIRILRCLVGIYHHRTTDGFKQTEAVDDTFIIVQGFKNCPCERRVITSSVFYRFKTSRCHHHTGFQARQFL